MSTRQKTILAVYITSLLSLAQLASASPISISVTGTANESAFGYTDGQSYTFTWVLNPDRIENPTKDSFVATANNWMEGDTTDSPNFSNFYGDELSGTYSRPEASLGNPRASLRFISDKLYISLSSDDSASDPIGLTASGVDLWYVNASELVLSDFTPSYPGTYTDPSAYFDTIKGSYTVSGGNVRMSLSDFTSIEFTPTAIGVVPEPSTMALLSVTGILIFITRGRFRR